MISAKTLLAAFVLIALTSATPVPRTADADLTKCGQAFGKTNVLVSQACSLSTLDVIGSIDPDLEKIGQSTCADAAAVALAAITPACGESTAPSSASASKASAVKATSTKATKATSTKVVNKTTTAKAKPTETQTEKIKVSNPSSAKVQFGQSKQSQSGKIKVSKSSSAKVQFGKSKRASAANALTACTDGLETAFRSFVTACGGDPDGDPEVTKGLKDSAACEKAKTSALSAITSACPASNAKAASVSGALSAAASTGKDAGELANAGQVVASTIAQGKKLTDASLDSCADSLVLASDLPAAVCSINSAHAGVAALAKKACNDASASVLSVVAVPCGLGGAEKSDPQDFLAGVEEGEGKSCAEVTTIANNEYTTACSDDGTEAGNFVPSGACSRAMVKAMGLLAGTCPLAQS